MSKPIDHPVRENGVNGTVRIEGMTLVRTIKKFIGKDDVQTFPLRAITSVHVDRRTFGSDIITLAIGHQTVEWKTPGAQALADAINEASFQR